MLTEIELVAAEVAAGVCGLYDHGFTGDGGSGEGESVRHLVNIIPPCCVAVMKWTYL